MTFVLATLGTKAASGDELRLGTQFAEPDRKILYALALRDRISFSELEEIIIGASSEAISQALDRLAQKDLIQVGRTTVSITALGKKEIEKNLQRISSCIEMLEK